MEKVPGHLQLREVILLADGTEVAVGHGMGGQFLVIAVSESSGRCWVCAPATDAAIECVRAGRSSPWTVAHHSATGTVDLFRSGLDGTVAESVLLCSELRLGPKVLAAA